MSLKIEMNKDYAFVDLHIIPDDLYKHIINRLPKPTTDDELLSLLLRHFNSMIKDDDEFTIHNLKKAEDLVELIHYGDGG